MTAHSGAPPRGTFGGPCMTAGCTYLGRYISYSEAHLGSSAPYRCFNCCTDVDSLYLSEHRSLPSEHRCTLPPARTERDYQCPDCGQRWRATIQWAETK